MIRLTAYKAGDFEWPRPAAQIIVYETQREHSRGDIQLLALHAHHARIPVQPDCPARPWPGPGFAVGRLHQLRVLTEEIDPALEERHLGVALPPGLLARPFPEIQHFPERLDVRGVLFAHPDIPGIVLAKMQPQGVGTHRDAYPEIAIAKENAFEEIRSGLGAHEWMFSGNRRRVHAVLRPGRGACGGDAGTQCRGRLEEPAAVVFPCVRLVHIGILAQKREERVPESF